MDSVTLSQQSRDRLPRRSRAKAGEESVGPPTEIASGNDLSGTLQSLPRERNVKLVQWTAAEGLVGQNAILPFLPLSRGKGGIGGLLARSDRMKIIPGILSPLNPDPQWVNTAYYHSDRNGNITALIAQTPYGLT